LLLVDGEANEVVLPAMDGDGYIWLDGARVVGSFLVQHVEVQGRRVPFPAGILHPDCTLQGIGDTGRLGVPEWWARQEGLC
jgi:hypothetical protein